MLRRRAPLPPGSGWAGRAGPAARRRPGRRGSGAVRGRGRRRRGRGSTPASRRVRVAGAVGTLAELFAHRAAAGAAAGRAGPGSAPARCTSRPGWPTPWSPCSGSTTARRAAAGSVRGRRGGAQLHPAASSPTVYAMPAGTDGTGTTLAIIELGGGFDATDLEHTSGLGVPAEGSGRSASTARERARGRPPAPTAR